MISKSLAVSVVIGGALAASFNRAFQTADKRTSKLGESLAKLTIKKESITSFRRLESTLGKTATQLQSASRKTEEFGRAIAKSQAEIKKLEEAGKKSGDTATKAMQQSSVKLDALKVAYDKSSRSSDAMNNKIRESVAKLKELKKASAQAKEQLKNTSKISWNQFTAQRMSKYMKDLGGHKNAIKQISKEYDVYKKTGVNAFDDVSESSNANKAAIQQANSETVKAAKAVEQLKRAIVDEKKANTEASKTHQQLSKDLRDAKKEHNSMAKSQQQAASTTNKELAKEQAALKKLQQEFKKSASTSGRLKDAHRSQRDELRTLRGELRGAGIDTRKLSDEERRLGDAIKRTNTAINQQNSRNRRRDQAGKRLEEMKSRAIGAAGAAYGVGRVIGNNARFEHQLTMTANTGGLSKEQKASLREQLRQESSKTNQSKDDLLAGVDFLIGKGLSFDDAVASIGKIGMTATASGASVLDLSRSAFAMMDNMKLPSKEIKTALDIITSSGKQGGFELKAMATYFPTLTAQAQALGLKGKKGIAELGAALQIAVKGAGSEGEGANNLQNFLAKITSKDTVKNLKKMGVSVQDVFARAKADGKSPLIEIIKEIKNVTGGDAFKLNEIFGDMQVKNFLNPMLENIDEFNKIYKKSLTAQGVNQKDFLEVMGDTSEKFKAMKIQATNAGNAFARTLKPAVDLVLGGLTSVAHWSSDVITKFPIIGQVIGGVVIGVIGYTAAVGLATAAQWLWNTSIAAGTANALKNVAARKLMLGKIGAVGLAAAGGYAAGTYLNNIANKGIIALTEGENKTVAGWIYDAINSKPVQPIKASQLSAINDNSQITLHVTQNKGEDGQVFAARTATLIEDAKNRSRESALHDLPQLAF